MKKQSTLFVRTPQCLRLDDDCELLYYPDWLLADESKRLFDSLCRKVVWRHEEIIMMGKKILQPRLTAWYGDPNAHYRYAGLDNVPSPWFDELSTLKTRVESEAEHEFNSVLLNRYRDGRDSMGYHADDEPELGMNPCIASISLGGRRRFLLRHRSDKKREVFKFELEDGSLLLMKGATQHHYKHSVPKTKRVVGERINLTFRLVR